jgi:hypothetical protein
MKAATRIDTQQRRFDIRMAAKCVEQNEKVVGEVLADENATISHRREARELRRLTELSLTGAVQAYLKLL